MRDSAVSLRVWGQVLSGWTSVEIIDSIETLSPTFSLEYSDRCLTPDRTIRVSPGDECALRIGDEMVLTGYVDDSELAESASSRSLSVSGRSRTADLVDCSVALKPSEWRNATIDRIAEDLCKPFAILVFAQTSVGEPFSRFAVEPGETVFDCLSRAARQRGLMLQSTTSGDLAIAKLGARSAPGLLRRGQNILSASLSLSWAERYSEIRVLSQPDDGGIFNKAASQTFAAARDENIRRKRPLVIVADAGETSAQLRERANWEVSSRAGKGSRLSVTVRGWGTDTGLWRPNAVVHVDHDWLGLDTSMLISSVRYSLDADGTTSTLDLCPVGAFAPEPFEAKANPEETWP